MKNYTSLRGNELLLFNYVFTLLEDYGGDTTPPLAMEHILEETTLKTKGIVKTTLQRLISKKALIRGVGTVGRNGFIIIKMPPHLLDQKRRSNARIQKNKWVTERITERVTERVTKSPSSSSSNNLNTTTTINIENEKNKNLIRAEEIEISHLEHIGFKEAHLNQILRNSTLTTNEIDESLKAFSFDLLHNKLKAKKSPLNMIVGLLMKGQTYNPPENYKTQEEIQAEKEKKEAEERKEREEFELLRIKEANETVLFIRWKQTLKDEDLSKILHEQQETINRIESKMFRNKVIDGELRSYFLDNIMGKKPYTIDYIK